MKKVTEIEKAELLNAVKLDTKLHDIMRRLLIEHDVVIEQEKTKSEFTRVIARNLVAWDTSKDKREGLLPEVYLTNKWLYKRLTGEEYYKDRAIEKFNLEES